MENKYDLELYNCGGFALNLHKWITPYVDTYCNDRNIYSESERGRIVMSMIANNFSQDIITEELLECDVSYLVATYPQLVPIDLAEAADNDRIIAYRLMVPDIEDPDFSYEDIDFHFRVRINGFWFEKIGGEEIRFCGFTEEPWASTPSLIYDSPIRYFKMEATNEGLLHTT